MADFIGQYLSGGPASLGLAFGQELWEQAQYRKLPEEERLRMQATPTDLDDIKNFLEAAPLLPENERKKRYAKLLARLDNNSIPYLDYMYRSRVGPAPKMTPAIWREAGYPEEAIRGVSQAIAGTRPGHLEELALSALGPEARDAELMRRIQDLIAKYPGYGIEEMARSMIPKGTEGVLSPEEQKRQMAREAGVWPEVTAVTRGWGRLTPYQKKKDLREKIASGQVSPLAAEAIKTLPIYGSMPEWASRIKSPVVLKQLGISPDGEDISSKDDPVKYAQQVLLRQVLDTKEEELPPVNDTMKLVVLGTKAMTPEERDAFEAAEEGRTAYSPLLERYIRKPLISYDPKKPEFWGALFGLYVLFPDPEQLAAVLKFALSSKAMTGE